MTDNKKKGGRPRLSKTEKKKFKLPPVRLGMLDYVTVKNRSKKAGLTMTEYQRQMLLNGQVVERVSTEQMELYRQLAGMGDNMNQLAHQANKYGYYKDAGMYHENAMQVSNLINQILHDGKDNKRA
ncbi:MAG: plasmid mobilization relaxosome protein MobC [Prevotella sp.]|nr:plasmid mobilization relaxosome protein MobC [Prevotella sp.]